jgi:hypothetical protein
MPFRPFQLARLIVVLAIVLLSQAPLSRNEDATRSMTHDEVAQQVRLRKLHLVRPDLIPYPISFEVYC